MWNFQKTFKSIGGIFTMKSYQGILHGGLPVNSNVWDGDDFLKAIEISLYTNKAIAKRADKVGEIDWQLSDERGNEIERDPLLDLLYKPNTLFTGRQFWALYQTYYDTLGEVYILLEKNRRPFETNSKIIAMHILPPLKVKPIFNTDGTIEKFEYETKDGSKHYTTEEVLYIHNPNPKNPLRGQSLLKAGVNAIQTETQIATYHSRVLENGGKVEGVFKFKTGLTTKEQLKEVKDKYKKEYADAKKSGIPLFLGGDADYIRTGLSPEELSFLEAKRMTLEDICILTGVPKSMLASTNDAKFDNADADRAIFLRETIKPLLTTLTTYLDEFLFPDNRTLTFVDPTPENVDQKLKETESGLKNSYMTINEARQRHGYDPIANGDDILVPFNLMPLGAEPATTDTQKALKKNIQDHPLKDPDVRRLYYKMQLKKLDKRSNILEKKIDLYFKEQEERLIESIRVAKRFRHKGFPEDILQLELEIKIGNELLFPILYELLKAAGEDAMDFAGSTYAFSITENISSWLEKRASIFLTQINQTTFETLKNQFTESLAAGEDRDSLINRIQNTYGNITEGRARTIARTEVHNATQYGTMQGYKQAGFTSKIWVAVMDSATRDSHASVDGEERPMDTPFSNGLMFPGDPNGPAEEIINCRCVF